MPRAICRLCAHVNPEGARFCNECGSPLTLVACPECEAINGLDAAHCHQCGASLGTDEQEVDAPIPASKATSVPTPQSGPLLDGTSGDRTPIALAERFERRPASSRRTPPLGRVDERAAVRIRAREEFAEIALDQALRRERILVDRRCACGRSRTRCLSFCERA